VQALAVLENGARAVYHFSGALPFGQAAGITLYGSDGVLHYDITSDRIRGAGRKAGLSGARLDELQEIPIPPDRARAWQVEADFVQSIRTGAPVRFTDFATGVAYMEFTEAVARSAQSGAAVELPLTDEE
jgi:predicted dehydrogenase